VLLTGTGGIGGVDFARALKFGAKQERSNLFLVGTEFNEYYIRFPQLEVSLRTPRHSDPSFVQILKNVITKHKVKFLHPNPSSEASVVAKHLGEFKRLGTKTLLPNARSISPSKEFIWRRMKRYSVAVPDALFISSTEDVSRAFDSLGAPLWLRAKHGAGARLSLKVETPEEARLWIKLNILQKRVRSISEFVLQKFLNGRDIAFDSLWHHGTLISSSTRVRLEYPLKHISLTGLTGTPSVARIVHEKKLTELGIESVKALDCKPNGFYSTDIKEDEDGRPWVTEVDGKWHTTASLWGYALAKAKNEPRYNIAYTYLRLGMGEIETGEIGESIDLYPDRFTLIRQMDSGVVLLDDNKNRSWRIL
jgi:hypothetical protein